MPWAVKKPIAVEYFPCCDLLRWAKEHWASLPQWIVDDYNTGNIIFADNYISINTLEGTMVAEFTDIVIRGIKGEIYPCKLEIFNESYTRGKKD